MKTFKLYLILFTLSHLFLACKDDIDQSNPPVSIVACDDIIPGWNLSSFDFPKTQAQRDFYFLNEQVGFSVGNAGSILKTTDGGQTWKIIHYSYSSETGYNHDAVTDAELDAVYFANDSVGFTGGDGENDYFDHIFTDAVLMKTRDGGATWTKQYLDGVDEVKDLIFFDELNGIGLFEIKDTFEYQIRFTSDGGDHWIQIAMPEVSILSHTFVTSPSKTMVVAENSQRAKELWSTSDHGLSWQSTGLPGENVGPIYFVNDEIAFADCTPTNFPDGNYYTRDGGATWIEIETPFYSWSIMHFRNELEGFVINPVYGEMSGGGEITFFIKAFDGYQTLDGGATWTKTVVEGNCKFHGLDYSPSKNKLYILDYPVITLLEQ